MISRTRRAVITAAVAGALALLAAAPASADTTGPLAPDWTSINGYTGPQAVLAGMTVAKFPTVSGSSIVSASAWASTPFGALPTRYLDSWSTATTRPLAYVLSDPYVTAQSAGSTTWTTWAKINFTPDTEKVSQLVLGATFIYYCSAEATGVGTGVIGQSQVNVTTASAASPAYLQMTNTCPAVRPYMLALSVQVNWYTRQGDATSLASSYQWWSSGVYRAGGRKVTPSVEWCALVDPTHSGVCLWVPGDNTGGRGGSFGDEALNARAADFAVVCANPPQAEWLSFSWLGPWVGHYADCLFVPRGGMTLDKAETNLNDSFVGDISGLAEGVKSVQMPATRCGVLADTTLPLGITNMRLTIDTCAEPWPRFSPIRTTLGIALIVMTVISSVYALGRVAGFNWAKGGAA